MERMDNYLRVTLVFICLSVNLGQINCQKLSISLNEGISQQEIQSAGYPLINCLTGGTYSSWHVTTSIPGHHIQLTCDRFAILLGCKLGKLIVQDGNSVRQFCDGNEKIDIKSKNNNLIVEFRLNRCGVGNVKCLAKSVAKDLDLNKDDDNIDSQAVIKSTSCSCGWRNQVRIVGGVETKINEYPLMASIITRSNGLRICGGSIITKYHILTAAHCTIGRTWTPLTVVTGEHDFSKAYETNATGKYDVQHFIQHEQFSTRTLENDIAIAIVNKAIDFNRYVGPVCLPIDQSVVQNELVTALGWGYTTSKLAISSDVLRSVTLRVVNTRSCALHYNTLRSYTKSQFCTYARNKDTCQGDSGGPLLKLDADTGRYTQYGIVSYGKTCASEVPAVNVDVYYFTNWIKSIVEMHRSNLQICHKL